MGTQTVLEALFISPLSSPLVRSLQFLPEADESIADNDMNCLVSAASSESHTRAILAWLPEEAWIREEIDVRGWESEPAGGHLWEVAGGDNAAQILSSSPAFQELLGTADPQP